jgi:lysophospholipase L1-like esterase
MMATAWLALGAAGAHAQSDVPVLAADASETGYVNLVAFGQPGTQVALSEVVDGRHTELGAGTVQYYGAFYVLRATQWRCDRLVRRFRATMVDPQGRSHSGRFSLRTPSCRNRLSVEVPPEVAPGAPFTARVVDGWGIGGIGAKVCAALAGEEEACGAVQVVRGTAHTERELRLPRPGIWSVAVRLGRYRDRVRVGVGVPAPAVPMRPVVLTTGDSTIQGIESYLQDRLPGRARIARHYLVGSGISRPITPYWPYWPSEAQRQAQERAPRLTVISIGANDAHPMEAPGGGHVSCCGEAWVAEYARRASEMMSAYVRSGEGRVLWLTLPAPRKPPRIVHTAAVNDAIRRAASGQQHVRLVELDEIFTPGFRYRERMRDRGRRVLVRQPDGIHLTAKGTEIAARAVAYAARQWPGALR